MLDASGKVPEGILSGTLSSLGAYDECLETRLGGGSHDVSGDASSSSRIVTGQYCSIDIKPYLPPKPPSNSLNRIFNEAADAKGFPKVSPLVFLLTFTLFMKRDLNLLLDKLLMLPCNPQSMPRILNPSLL